MPQDLPNSWVLVVALLAAACSSPSKTQTSAFDPTLLSTCPESAAVPGVDCTGLDTYRACLGEQCAVAYQTCFGAHFTTGDFSGGVCADYAACLGQAPQICATSCSVPDADCQSCLSGLGNCVVAATCSLPICEAAGFDGGLGGAGGASDGGGVTGAGGATAMGGAANTGGAHSGGSTSTGGTKGTGGMPASGGMPGAGGATSSGGATSTGGATDIPPGTCDDLNRCCQSISDLTTKEECASTYTVYDGSDPLCAYALQQFLASCPSVMP
jgi:hypothetical protein